MFLVRFRSLFTGMLFSLLTLPALAGEKITFWIGFQATELTEKLCKAFTRQSGIAVDIHYIDGTAYKSELIKSAIEGEAPDVALFPADFLALDKELRYSIVPTAAQSKDLIAQARQTGLQGEVVLGAPVYWGNHLVLYYNRDFVKTPASSFEQLEKQAAAFKAKRITPLAISFEEMYSFVSFVGAFGGWPLDAQGNPTLDTPATRQALSYYFGLASKGLVDKGCWDDCSPYEFADGKAAYYLGGDWKYRWFAKQLGPQLGVTTLPTVGNRPLISMFSSYLLAFPMDSLNGRKREALLKFIAFMQSPAVQARWADEAKVLPVNARVFKAFSANASPNQRAILQQLQRSRVMPNHRNMAFAWEGMFKGFSAMDNERADVGQAARIMQKTTEKAIKNAGR